MSNFLSITPEVIFKFIKDHCSVFPVEKMCQLFDVSRSGFYEWLIRPVSNRKSENGKILELARKNHNQSNGIYGLDKILRDVNEKIPCSRNRLYRILKENKIYSKRPKKYKATTNSNHKLPVAENLLNQNFEYSNRKVHAFR